MVSIDDRVRQPAEPISGVHRHAIEAFGAQIAEPSRYIHGDYAADYISCREYGLSELNSARHIPTRRGVQLAQTAHTRLAVLHVLGDD